jgi:hypothetical protein
MTLPIMELFVREILPTFTPEQLLMLEKKLFTTTTEGTNIPDIFQSIMPS